MSNKDLTPEEVHALCHELSGTRGCAEYQCKLYGASMPGTMNSKPHILDLEHLRDTLCFSIDVNGLHFVHGNHLANANVIARIDHLIRHWRDNVPTSRKAEVLVNGEDKEKRT